MTSTSGERSTQRVLSVCLSSLGRNEGIVKQRPKKKKIVKKISREVKKVEEELKPGEEKVTHNQKSLGCQAKDLEQEETHEDPLTVNLTCL